MKHNMYYTLSFGEDPNVILPKHLYKYRDWNNLFHRELLADNVIYLASPKSFTDKRDCKLPYKFPRSVRQVYKWFFKELKSENLTFTQRQKRAKKLALTSPILKYKERWEKVKAIQAEFNERFGVFSVCNVRDDEQMWNEYGNNHAGFCIVYDTSKLRTVCGGGGKCFYFKKPYIDFLYDNDDVKVIKRIFYKSAKYSYEKEYRLTKFWISLPSKNRKPVLPEGSIVEVILGRQMPQQDKDEIRKIVFSKHPNTIVTEME